MPYRHQHVRDDLHLQHVRRQLQRRLRIGQYVRKHLPGQLHSDHLRTITRSAFHH